MMACSSWWILLFLCFFGTEYHVRSVESQIIKLPNLRLRWPTFNRRKKDTPVELKPTATNQNPSVNYIFEGGKGASSGPHRGNLGPPAPPMTPPSGLYPPMGYGSPFAPFGRPPGPFVFPNIASGPMQPPPSSTSYYSSYPGSRKGRRRRPIYDNDSLEDTSTEDEPVYIKVKSQKRRPIVIDEDDLMGRGHDGGFSEESLDAPKISYKSRTKPQVVYLDSFRDYPSANKRRLLLKNEDMVQDSPSYHSPAISALHASVGSGGYHINSRLTSRPSQSDLLFLNDLDNSAAGPEYIFDSSGDHKFRSNQGDFSGHFDVQNMGSVDQQQQAAKSFLAESSTNSPLIHFVMKSMNQDSKQQTVPSTPDPAQQNQAQIPSPQSQPSMNHFQLFDPTHAVLHDKRFHFGRHSNSGWSAQSPTPPTLSHSQKHPDTVKVARRSFYTGKVPSAAPLTAQPPLIKHFHAGPPRPPLPPPTVFMEKAARKRAPAHQNRQTAPTPAQEIQQVVDFSCANKRSGYYANRKYKCQIYHQCSKRALMQTFICPDRTAFNEKQKLCERAQKVACVPDDHRQKNQAMPPTTELPQISSRMDEMSGELVDVNFSTLPTIRSDKTTTADPEETRYSTSVSYSHRASSSSSAAPEAKADVAATVAKH